MRKKPQSAWIGKTKLGAVPYVTAWTMLRGSMHLSATADRLSRSTQQLVRNAP
jgi:hypothetical protein